MTGAARLSSRLVTRHGYSGHPLTSLIAQIDRSELLECFMSEKKTAPLSESKRVCCDLMREWIVSITKAQHDRITTQTRGQRECSIARARG